MPYIRRVDRKVFHDILHKIYVRISKIKDKQERAGILNYLITSILMDCMAPRKYSEHALIFGILETVKHEIYRRRTIPYEEEKCRENGDIRWDWGS